MGNLMEKRKLMASFTVQSRVMEFIKYLHDGDITDKIFILKNNKQKNIFIVTYNLLKEADMSSLREYGVLNTLIIQRNIQ